MLKPGTCTDSPIRLRRTSSTQTTWFGSTPALIVCATFRNEGDVSVGPGLVVSFYDGDPDAGGTLIGSAPTTRDLTPAPGGTSERVCVEWPMAPTEPRAVYARVDSEGGARECIEDNNTVSLGEARCMTVM